MGYAVVLGAFQREQTDSIDNPLLRLVLELAKVFFMPPLEASTPPTDLEPSHRHAWL